MPNSKNFSLVITTFNRPDYLSRILSYLHFKEAKFKVIVSDASEQSVQTANSGNIETYRKQGLDVTHLSIRDKADIYESMLEGVRIVDTEYMQLMADDDFIIPEVSLKLIGFLERNETFTAAIGSFIYFTTHNNQAFGRVRSFSETTMVKYSREEDSAMDRVLASLQKPADSALTTYAVMKSQAAKNAYEKALSIDGLNHKQTETLISHLVHTGGKVKVIPEVGGLRQMHLSNNANIAHKRFTPKLTTWMTNWNEVAFYGFPPSFAKMANLCASEFSSTMGVSLTQATTFVSGWYTVIWGKYFFDESSIIQKISYNIASSDLDIFLKRFNGYLHYLRRVLRVLRYLSGIGLDTDLRTLKEVSVYIKNRR